jgi:hypothetical protein
MIPNTQANTQTPTIQSSFFLVTEKYIIGTPDIRTPSDELKDIPFHEFAQNYELQRKLGLQSTAFIRPPTLNKPKLYSQEKPDPIENVASFLAAACIDPLQRRERENYFKNDGLIRIIVLDEKLQHDLIELQGRQKISKSYRPYIQRGVLNL